ncbi:uncharacterized protein LOC115446262 isoform X2 [Manduca sexta]|uniref:uncharacterized protein LOC115446262 isoform X2 n=1 Tax=Manduca sexta TaxID=7130 RepID=UPI001182F719|nr:uncharacterized protein LOC115446262 isoform X2 [Manduca sexta]
MCLQCQFHYRMFIISVCAPKLERLLTNSISSESNYLENDDIIVPRQNFHILRAIDNSQEISKKDCAGYDYDATKCKYVNDRILCGYNKNLGNFNDNKDVIDLGNGCQMRGNRIECGYLVGPFVNPRRPPAHDNEEEYHTEQTPRRKATNAIKYLELTEKEKVIENTKPTTKLVVLNDSKTKETEKPILDTLTTKKMTPNTPNTKNTPFFSTTLKKITTKIYKFNITSTPPKTSPQTTESAAIEIISTKKKPMSKCVEKGDRIVCYD